MKLNWMALWLYIFWYWTIVVDSTGLTQEKDENCHVNLLIPKQHFNANCGLENIQNVKMWLESEIKSLKHEIQLLERTSCDNLAGRVATLEGVFPKLVNLLDSKPVEKTEVDIKLTDIVNKKKLVRIFKPFLKSEFEEMKRWLVNEFEDRLSEMGSETFQDKSMLNTQPSHGNTEKVTPNEGKTKTIAHQKEHNRQHSSFKQANEQSLEIQKLKEDLLEKFRSHSVRTQREISAVVEHYKKIENIDVKKELELVKKEIHNLTERLNFLSDKAVTDDSFHILVKQSVNEHAMKIEENLKKPSSHISHKISALTKNVQNVESMWESKLSQLNETLRIKMAQFSESLVLLQKDIEEIKAEQHQVKRDDAFDRVQEDKMCEKVEECCQKTLEQVYSTQAHSMEHYASDILQLNKSILTLNQTLNQISLQQGALESDIMKLRSNYEENVQSVLKTAQDEIRLLQSEMEKIL